MSDHKDRKIIFPKGGMLGDVSLRIKLILRLMADSRVSIFLKALPILTLVYLLFPDLAPGPIDDVAIIWLGTFLFVELCPPDVVQEHMNALRQVVPGKWRDAGEHEIQNHEIPNQTIDDEENPVVDVDFWDKTER